LISDNNVAVASDAGSTLRLAVSDQRLDASPVRPSTRPVPLYINRFRRALRRPGDGDGDGDD
jgi:hypothetical protein